MGMSGSARETNPNLRGKARVHGVELRRMGQFDKLGRYPFHWHFIGSAPNDFISGSAVHSSLQRGIVVHSTDDVTVRDNVVYNTPGHAYVVEDGTERRVTFERNLGLMPRAITLTNSVLSTQADGAAATYWLRTASVKFVGNVSAGGDFAGVWFDLSFIDGANDTKSQLVFRDNTLHSHGGSRVPGTESDTWSLWHTDGYVPSEEGVLLFDRVNAYKNLRAIETAGRGETTNAILSDNGKAISNHVLKDSLVVSQSANTDTDEEWGATGLFAYGGFARAENVSWVNFNNGRQVLRTLACGIEYPRFSMSRSKLINSTPAAGCGDAITHDTDGTVSGTGRPQKIVPYGTNSTDQTFGLVTSACTLQAALGVAVCPEYDYRGLTVTYPISSSFSNPDWVIDVVRDEDSNRVRPNHFRWMSYVIPGKSYRLEVKSARSETDPNIYPLASLSDITLGLDRGDVSNAVLPGGESGMYDPAWANRTITVTAPAPTTAFRILRCPRNVECEQSFQQGNWVPIGAASTVAALAAMTTSGYVIDSTSGRIVFRLYGDEKLRFERQ
jgi:hypothetical protein